MKKKIFISYRRSELYNTQRLAKFLQGEFGLENIFFDSDSISPGVEWPATIESALDQCDIMLLIIGPNWLNTLDEPTGKRRIDLESDWVRKETLSFMARKKADPELILIPVLVHGAKMPGKNDLDSALAPIPDSQAIRLDDFGNSLDFVQIKYYLISNRIVPIYYPPVVTPVRLPIPPALTRKQEETFTEKYPKWKFVNTDKPGVPGNYLRELYGFFEFATYHEAWKFISDVNKRAIVPCNHHPRWQNTYNRVEFWLSTFNIDHKPSERDIRFAEIVEKIWDDFYAKTSTPSNKRRIRDTL